MIGCLCISTSLPRDGATITIWIMAVKESWTKNKITEPNLDDSLCTLLCSSSITDDDDVKEELVVYNLKENRLKDLLIDVYMKLQLLWIALSLLTSATKLRVNVLCDVQDDAVYKVLREHIFLCIIHLYPPLPLDYSKASVFSFV